MALTRCKKLSLVNIGILCDSLKSESASPEPRLAIPLSSEVLTVLVHSLWSLSLELCVLFGRHELQARLSPRGEPARASKDRVEPQSHFSILALVHHV